MSNAGSSRKTGPGRVLLVDDHLPARESMADVLRRAGHTVDCCSSGAEALAAAARSRYECIVTDMKMPGMSGLELIAELAARGEQAQVVMVTAHATVASAVEAMRHGAFDYIEKPFDVDRFERLVAQAIGHGRYLAGVRQAEGGSREPPAELIGSSPAMQALRARIASVARTPVTVLISGESGTGKELVAAAIHAESERRDRPLVMLNCPALSADLLASELFGHERGAFTGADTARIGRFEAADGGTILLDEVTEIDLPVQAKLLRVLQERCFERVGSNRTLRVDVRVLAATNRDLAAAVAEGRFRHDLYYRLAVVPLQVPPLRERPEDIAALVEHFLVRTARYLNREPCTLSAGTLDLLIEHDWPGNVRELENLITRASVQSDGWPIDADQLRRWLLAAAEPAARKTAEDAELPVGLSLQEMERRLIEATLERFGGHREKTARALGIGVRTLTGKLRQYGYAPREKSYSRAG